MIKFHLLFSVLALLSATTLAQDNSSPSATRLADLINAYRAEQGLDPIPVSVSLTKVAEAHALDLEATTWPDQCNMHSWSKSSQWSDCCFTSVNAPSECMWDKPREITGGLYAGSGFEISYGGSEGVSPDNALLSWKSSAGHNNVIINQKGWASFQWQAMGVAVSERYALVWFGKDADPADRQ